MNHVHIDDEAVETTLPISSLRIVKDLLDPYKDHSFYQGLVNEETPIVITEQDIISEDEEEQTNTEPNPDKNRLHVPYPQVLNHPKA